MNLTKVLTSALVAIPVALFATSAWAVPCDTDADCEEGQFCVYEEDCLCPDDDGDGEPDCVCPGECLDIEEGVVDDAECASDEDCPTGFICEIRTEDICMGMGCPPGEDCPEEDFCEEYTYSMCVPDFAPCEADADCGDGLVCLTYEYEECDDIAETPPCAGDDCPEPEPSDESACETVSESFCAPPYVAPCEVDSDCGEGFACVPEEVCWCGGSSGSGSAGSSGGSSGGVPDPIPDPAPTPDPDTPGEDDGGDVPTDPEGDEVPEEDCGCEATGDLYCEPLEITCEADADCPDGWSCEDVGAVVSNCFEDEETGEVTCDQGVEDSEAYCMPPYFEYWGGGTGSDASGSYEEVLDEATGRDGESTDGSISGGGSSQNAAADGGEGRPASEGCSAAGGGPSAPLAAGLMLGLVAVTRRRR